MKPISGTLRSRFSFGAAIALLMSLSFAGSAWGIYLNDGAKPGTGAELYANPGDGFCVSGIRTDGTMTLVPGITNFRDCVAYTTGLNGMTATDVTSLSTCSTAGVAPFDKPCNVAANCARPEGYLSWVAALQKCFDNSACTIQGAAGNDGAKHTYSTSLCINAASRAGISRVDLDNTSANCKEKGGVLADGLYGHPYGACSAYGWIWGGVKSDGSLPTVGNNGVLASENLGFCYTSMRMTSVPYNVVTCPSQNNLSLVCTGGTNLGKTCTVAKQATDCPGVGGGTCAANAANGGWATGLVNDGVLYQSQTSYDAGLGWSFSTSTVSPPANHCLYQYGVQGYLHTDLRGPDGAIAPAAPLCGGSTGAATAGTCVDLTGIANQGACLAIGGTWDNWIPVLSAGTPHGAATQPVATLPLASTIRRLDATTTIANGGGKFYSGTGSVCLKCHSDQSRQTMERDKPGYVDTGHKLAGDTPPWTTVGNAWGLKGVQCEICHATGKATAQDLGTIIYQTKVCVGGTAAGTACTLDPDPVCAGGGVCTAGVPRGASGHNQTEYGSHVTGVCFTCHGTATNPGNVIPVAAGDFAPTAKNLAPIANEFLNSPHAEYTGSGNKLDVITKTNYASSFGGNICRSGSEVTDAATLRTSTSTTACSGAAGNGADMTTLSACNCPTYGGTWNATTGKCGIVVAGSFDLANCVAVAGGTWNAVTLQCDFTAVKATTCAILNPTGGVWNAVTSKCYDSAACLATPSPVKSWDSGTLRCVENSASCTPQNDSGYNYIWSTTGVAGNPSIITTSGAGCYKPFGAGTIYATYFDTATGTAKRIPFLDSATNPACTSPTAGAGAFWIADGEAAGTTTNGVAYPGTDQGNCMTCHDVHWSLESTNAEAEPLRRECTTCHVNSGTSASGAPQILIAPTKFNHPATGGTPLANLATDPNESCETCHMPKSSATGSPMHLWRINTSAAYETMGATQANVAADGSYANAAWVDVDHACGQCHGGGDGGPGHPPAKPGMPYFTTGQMAVGAMGMHVGSSTTTPPTPGATQTCTPNLNTWTMTVLDTSPDQTYISRESVDWNDGSVVADDRTAPFFNPAVSHTYIAAGTYTILHTVVNTVGQVATNTCPATWSYFTISGTVTGGPGNLPGVTVTVTNEANGLVAGAAVTADVTGAYSVGSLKPGSYTVAFSKAGYAIPTSTGVIVGASKTVSPVAAPALRAVKPPQMKKIPTNPGTGPSLR